MGRIASFDIETFCLEEELGEEDKEYLMKRRKKYHSDDEFKRDLSTNPYVSYVISFSIFVLNENKAYVYYLGEEDKLEVSNTDIGGVRVNVEYSSISLKDGLFKAERKLLHFLLDELKTIKALISFYGQDFDLEFIKVRTMAHHIKHEVFPMLLRKQIKHIDLRNIFNVGSRNYSLDFISRRLGLPVDKGDMHGSKVGEAFRAKEYKKIAEYNLKDALMAGLLYRKVYDLIKSH